MRALHAAFTVILALCLLLPAPAAAQAPAPIVPPGETITVRVYYPELATGNQLLLAFKPWLLETDYDAGYHLMEVGQAELERLATLGLWVVEDPAWIGPALATWPEVIEAIPGYPCYRTVEETFAAAQALAAAHPTLAAWIDAGDSWEKRAALGGYDMSVLKLTNSEIPGAKPKLFITAAIHAREYATAELVTRFAESLVNGYGTDPDATWILDHHELHLMLQANPDGRKQAETGLSWRKNTNQAYCGVTSAYRGADLNRNFDFEWNCCGGSSDYPCDITYHGAAAASEPETQAVQAYMASIFPDQRGPAPSDAAPLDATGIYIDVHSYGQLVLWPWGFVPDPAPNASQLQTLGRKFAYFNGHSPQQAFSLYPTDGTTDSYAYGKLGLASYCFEVGTAFFQTCGTFESSVLPANMAALRYAAKVVRAPYVTPGGPEALSLALSAASVEAGSAVTLSATLDDTRYNTTNGAEPVQAIAAAEYYVDVPPWAGGAPFAMEATDGSFDSTSEAARAVVATAGWPAGKHLVYVRGQDAGGTWGPFTAIFLTTLEVPNGIPSAEGQSATTAEDTPLAITLSGSDPDGDPLTYRVVALPVLGSLSGVAPTLSYTPLPDANGADSFSFVVNDGKIDSPPATVVITLTAVNDAPIALAQSIGTKLDTTVAITLTGADVDGDRLSYTVVMPPAHGTLSGSAPALSYTPASGYSGPDSFTFLVNDGQVDSAEAAVSITVTSTAVYLPLVYREAIAASLAAARAR